MGKTTDSEFPQWLLVIAFIIIIGAIVCFTLGRPIKNADHTIDVPQSASP